jgi:hypothetical protein
MKFLIPGRYASRIVQLLLLCGLRVRISVVYFFRVTFTAISDKDLERDARVFEMNNRESESRVCPHSNALSLVQGLPFQRLRVQLVLRVS